MSGQDVAVDEVKGSVVDYLSCSGDSKNALKWKLALLHPVKHQLESLHPHQDWRGDSSIVRIMLNRNPSTSLVMSQIRVELNRKRGMGLQRGGLAIPMCGRVKGGNLQLLC